MNAQAGIGDNHAPFDPKDIVNLEILAAQLRDTYSHLFKEQAALLKNAEDIMAGLVDGVKNDEQQATLTEQVAQLLTLLDAYHGKPASVHTVAKEPFLKGGRIVDAVLNAELAGPVRDMAERIKKVMKVYIDAKVKREQEERRAEAARQAKLAEERQAALTPKSTDTDLEDAMAAEQAAIDAAANAERSVAQVSQVRGDLGGLSSLRGKWLAKVIDEDKLPRKYMMPNKEAIALALAQSKDKKTGKPTIEIPGVEIYQETSISIRR